MKKTLLILVLLTVIVLSGGCSAAKDETDAQSDAALLRLYIVDCVNEGGDAWGVYQTALAKTRAAAGAEKAAEELSIGLTVAEKAAVSQRTNGMWQYYGAYYRDHGIGKAALLRFFTAQFLRARLCSFWFDAGGEYSVPEDQIKSSFYDGYAAVKLISGALYEYDALGGKKTLPAEAREAKTKEFALACAALNEGKSIDAAFGAIAADKNEYERSLETVLIAKNDAAYPGGFFERVAELGVNEADCFIIGDTVYTVLRVDALASGSDWYAARRDGVLLGMCSDALDTLLSERGGELDISEKEMIRFAEKLMK